MRLNGWMRLFHWSAPWVSCPFLVELLPRKGDMPVAQVAPRFALDVAT